MSTRTCLYCQRPQPASALECGDCGMPLPTHLPQLRRQRRFLWFCMGLTVFCVVMMLWLPRSV
ncbi:protein DnrP [Pseudomonas sp. UBA7530]|uniref:protein DnrP n=1 Tax=Pseudomonas sp. UBA7530 TaxID=1947341 RepID=UPI0018D8A382|nr:MULTISPECIES: protein DnrP [Pseudomonas]MBH3340270.1 protein DnrP [Pseudomonas mendocina]